MTAKRPENFVREVLLKETDHFDILTNIWIENMHGGNKRRGEIDLILFTTRGILVCEVKGGVSFEVAKKETPSGYQFEEWKYINEDGSSYTQKFSPFNQVRKNLESLRQWLISKDSSLKNVLFAQACIFPNLTFQNLEDNSLGNEKQITFDASSSNFQNFVDQCFDIEQSKEAYTSINLRQLTSQESAKICEYIYPKYMAQHITTESVRDDYIAAIKRHFYGPDWLKNEYKDLWGIDKPTLQFACGSIFPRNYIESLNENTSQQSSEDDKSLNMQASNEASGFKIGTKVMFSEDSDEDHEDIDAFNTNYPSSFGITFQASQGSKLVIKYGFSEYLKQSNNEFLTHHSHKKTNGEINIKDLNFNSIKFDKSSPETKDNLENTEVAIEIKLSKIDGNIGVQVFMTNNSGEGKDGPCYFQCGLKASLIDGALIPSKKKTERFETANLYKENNSYGKGLKTSVGWDSAKNEIWSDFIPTHTIPRISASNEHTKADLRFTTLANFENKSDEEYLENLNQFVSDYKKYLDGINLETTEDKKNIDQAKHFAWRLEQAVEVLKDDEDALRAFQLMNHTFHLTFQKNSLNKDNINPLLIFNKDSDASWRSFQIAFVLAIIPETVYPDEESYDGLRENVDLIWFPTGGGKTEAYNALLSFTIFYRRICNPKNSGVNVLMRYTLRFLTIDQFNRLASLITCMNLLRERNEEELGQDLISLGVWVGQASSINKISEAEKIIEKKKEKNKSLRQINPTFLLNQCPVCKWDLFDDSESGYVSHKFKHTHTPHCPKSDCIVEQIPVYQAEESTLERSPTAIIATVDSFAKLSWFDKKTNNIFNKDLEGVDPPELIIQDELHLIEGPLGSLVGLYDQLIRNFCSSEKPVKIVGSTATISNAKFQVRNLYGNRDLTLIPPPEKKWGNSFFMQESKKVGEDRIYVGLMSTSLSAPLTSQKIIASCINASTIHRRDIAKDKSKLAKCVDPYWTILSYFNSTKELSYAAAQVLEISAWNKREHTYANLFPFIGGLTRFIAPSRCTEITGRQSQSELNKVRDQLHNELDWQNGTNPLDIVLATNMISVGVDVPRLGVMIINGFPKSTSEYIQASSRVGREHPGIVLTSYRSTKKRDLSHYENFKTIHQSIYKMVEPVSVSPFSSGARSKGLIGLITAYLQFHNPKENPSEYSKNEIEEAAAWVLNETKKLYPQDDRLIRSCRTDLDDIINLWITNKPNKWGKMYITGDEQVLCAPFTGVKNDMFVFNQLTSLRNVGRELTISNYRG